jgi:ligand-binding sensor domain-containing protein/class 3 adenylate cyclase/HD superfamily phosphodiesterase
MLFPLFGISQNNSIKFTNLSLKEGLSQTSINSVVQDKKGFMWFATQDGLNRYDGYTFTVFKYDPLDTASLSNNFINVVFEDSEGLIWIGTEGGLNIFNPLNEKFRLVPLSHNSILSVCESNDSTIWVGTSEGGLYQYNKNSKIVTAYKNLFGKSIYFMRVEDLKFDYQTKKLWIGTNSGLICLNTINEEFQVYRHSPYNSQSLSNNNVLSVFIDKKGKAWAGTSDGLNYMTSEGKFRRFHSNENNPFGLSHHAIKAIHEDKVGDIWIGTSGGGLNKYDRSKNQFTRFQSHLNLPNSLANNTIYCITEDKTGSLWIGTNGGISRFDRSKQNFAHFRSIPGNSNSINSNVIWSLYKDSKGKIWAGTDQGLNSIDLQSEGVKRYLNKSSLHNRYSNESVYSILEDKSKIIWVGTDAGVFFIGPSDEFIPLKGQGKAFSELSGFRIYSLNEDSKKRLWIGTKEGLFILSGNRKNLSHFRHDPKKEGTIGNNVIRSVFEDSKGDIWVGTNGGGLNKAIFFNKDSLFFKSYKNSDDPFSLNNNIVLTITEDHNNTIWLGTYGGGLNKFDPVSEKFENFTEKNGLSNNVVYSVLSDSKGNLWMSTNKGLSMFNPHIGTFQNFYENDGLQSNEFNIGAYFKSTSGELFFGGINGFNVFHPENIHYNEIPPEIVITDFLIFNKRAVPSESGSPLTSSINYSRDITLSHKESVITFEFAALHFSSPEKNVYAYIMEGFEEEWNYVGTRRQATYTNLDPGIYTFRVKGANSDGVWNEEGISLKITILPPFWKTWWFRIFGLLFVFGIFFGIYKSRIKIIESQKRYLERQVRERTAEILNQKQKLESQKELLEKEKDKVDKLLLNMLPQEMVEELKTKGKASARHYRMSSIMFTDFKGFTQIAETIRPKDLVAELDRCFIKFDEIIEKYGLEKIKTIGDSYMCAGGLPIRNKSNPIDIVLAGLEIQRFIEELKQEKIKKGEKYWELRIGVNTGELIAGVIGTKRFAYDIWGDAVNIASRMEMNSEVGKVNVSGKTYEHIAEYFDCTYRGKVPAKNKGEIDMYYVDKIKPELSVNGEGIIPNELFRSKLATSLFYKINYKKAEQFIMKKLAEELPDDLYYHAIQHTEDVRDAAERIGKLEGVDGEDMMVLKTAAMYHDAGFTKQYFKNEPIAVEMAKEILPNFGYSPEQIESIEKMIMATQVPQTASTLLERILCDADLDYLGREDFYPIAEKLKKELMARGKITDDRQWDELQISFLEKHAYFTETSKEIREPEKQKRLMEIKLRYAANQYHILSNPSNTEDENGKLVNDPAT